MGIQRRSASALHGLQNAYKSIRREDLYDILIKVGISYELVSVIKMCLAETCRESPGSLEFV
jgi:hypothetical protein